VRAHVKLGSFHLLGIAFGGMIALHYASLFPHLLLTLVLSHTAPPYGDFGRLCSKNTEEFTAKLVATAAQSSKIAERKLEHVAFPSSLQRALTGYRVHSKDLARDVPQTFSNTDGLLVSWKRLIRKFALPPSGIQSKLEAMAKYHTEVTYTAASFATLACPVLLMDSERHDMFGAKSFEALKVLFPKATTNVMEGYGHLVVIVKGQDVAMEILKWMTSDYYPLRDRLLASDSDKLESYI
jgi:pimeloyl-ACP methyl ester carboxylesterase